MPNDNVYQMIDRYYGTLPKPSRSVLPRDTAERFLRKLAWGGESEENLKVKWCILELLAENSIAWDFPSWEYLSLTDYQEIYYQYTERREEVCVNEASLDFFFSTLVQFGSFCVGSESDPLLDHLRAARDSFYVRGKFIPPVRRDEDDFYSILEHQEIIAPEDMDRLNEALDRLLGVVGTYFRQAEFFLDITRAIMLYGGPDFDPAAVSDPDGREDFYLGFWDYFLFDYHLLESDMIPLAYYYRKNRKKLSFTEDSLIRDLLGAKLTVFYIEAVGEEAVICRDLFSDTTMELPIPDTFLADYKKLAFIGHVHANGTMLLNYVTTVYASQKLRERIKREVLRQYEWFICQNPEATLDDFFAREAASVRQIIRILTEYAQLNAVPMRECPKPVQNTAYLPRVLHGARTRLKNAARHFGFSAYSITLLCKLYADYALLSDEPDTDKESDTTLAAVFCTFSKLNGMGQAVTDEIIKHLKVPQTKVQRAMASVEKLLGCTQFDPRYAMEESFIRALHLE